MANFLEYVIYFLLVFIIVFIGDFFIIKKPIYDSLNNKQKKNKLLIKINRLQLMINQLLIIFYNCLCL